MTKFKGKYRVLGNLDLNTGDFPKDKFGNIEPSYDDYYIPCVGGQIYHYGKSLLVALIYSNERANNLITSINEINKDIIIDLVQNDETEFKFNSKYMDIVAPIMGARTKGANISPHSIKNFSKNKYVIPEEELQQYKELISKFELPEILNIFKLADEQIEKIIIKETKNKSFNIKSDRKLKGLKSKDYIHSVGMWNVLIDIMIDKLNINNSL